MEIFRAVDTAQPEHAQHPTRFVLGRPEFGPIAGSVNPARTAAALTRQAVNAGAQGIDRGWSWKCMAEWATEVQRLTIDVTLPSRLSCVFGFTNLEDAVAFAEAEHRPAVFRAHVDADRVAVRDMERALPSREVEVTESAFTEEWERLIIAAHEYWTTQDAIGVPEVLVDGEVCLELTPAWLHE